MNMYRMHGATDVKDVTTDAAIDSGWRPFRQGGGKFAVSKA
jgi:hypothetical protein